MTTTESRSGGVSGTATVDMKFEVVVLPVTNVDRAKEFYGRLGWRLDADRVVGDDFRLIQFTPPGSGCSIQFGKSLTSAAPGSAQAFLLIVSDVETAHDELMKRGIEVSDVYHCSSGTACRFRDGDGLFQRVNGSSPDHASYGSYASFSDPDGNAWVLQEVTTRLAGRIEPGAATTFVSVHDLEGALRRASSAHGEHEKQTGEADANWPEWYSRYMVAEQSGSELPR